jgi:hypothetical protein
LAPQPASNIRIHKKLAALGGAGASACQSERSSDRFFLDPVSLVNRGQLQYTRI